MRMRESLFWIIITCIPLLFLIPELFIPTEFRFTRIVNSVAASIGLFIFIVLFNLIFDALPIEFIRLRMKRRIIITSFGGLKSPFDSDQTSTAIDAPQTPDLLPQLSGAIRTRSPIEPPEIETIINSNPRELLALYSERTSEITNRIYTRAGVYLFVGVIISFTGLGFFYIKTSQTNSVYSAKIEEINPAHREIREESSLPTNDIIGRFLVLLPGFGILFFIEFIAFFFLRQYRAAMDEFRYFDAIRRSREENLIILKMFSENANIVATKDVLDAMRIYSSAGVLEKGQTTDIMESRKLQVDETVIFEKLIDVMSTLRNAEPKRKQKDEKK